MTAADNKLLMKAVFEGVSRGDGSGFVALLAEDVTLTVTGQYSWSRTFEGKVSILRDLYGYVNSLFDGPNTFVPTRFLADEDWVVVEGRGNNLTRSGQRYDNHYCMMYRLRDGRIVEIREYQDSSLCERVLGPYPAA